MTENAIVSFVDGNCVQLHLAWPDAEEFAGNQFVSTSAVWPSSRCSPKGHPLWVRFREPEDPAPPTITIFYPERFVMFEEPKVISPSESFKISHSKTTFYSHEKNGNRSYEDGYFIILKVWRGARPKSKKSIASLLMEVNLQFANASAQTAKSLSYDLLRVYHTQKGVDVTFKFEGETRELKAHKWLLCVRSEYFRRMFEAEMCEATTGEIRIDEFDSEIFEKVLIYLYSGDYSDIKETDEYLSCLRLADKYLLHELRKLCVGQISLLLDSENVGKVLAMAYLINCDSLLESSLEFLRSMNEVDRLKRLIDTGSFDLVNVYVDHLEKLKAD